MLRRTHLLVPWCQFLAERTGDLVRGAESVVRRTRSQRACRKNLPRWTWVLVPTHQFRASPDQTFASANQTFGPVDQEFGPADEKVGRRDQIARAREPMFVSADLEIGNA